MGKRKELSIKEEFIATKMCEMNKYSYKDNKVVRRNPSEVRGILNRRKNHDTYQGWRNLVEQILENKFEDMETFSRAISKYERLSKFQGYLVRDYAEAEYLASKMSDEQMKVWITLNAV